MGAIYASAKFTIIATDGDARYGIPGLKGISQRRNLQQPILDLKGEKYTIHKKVKLSNSHFDKQPYFLRAWTFQEFFLSKRRLIIADNQFHWICSTANFHEDLYGKDPKTTNAYDETARFRISDIISGIPNFREFGGLFDEYNERHLTFPEDALAGVSGIISIMSRSFDGGFIYGLPEMCFESALMWQPTFSVGVSRKRTHSKTDHSMLGVSHLPSWSWLGWKVSPLTIADENSGELYDAYPTTTCITHWYSHETAHASTKRAIRPTFLDFEGNLKNNRLDDQRALAQGWTKETFDAQKHGRPPEYDNSKNGLARLGNVVYQHHRLPGKLFWFPFSLTVVDETSSIIDRPQHPFLSCRTKRGWFQARKNHKEGGNHILQVLGRHGERCGTFTVNSLEFAADFPAADAEESIQVELVAICQRKWPHKDLVDVERSQGIENPKFDDQCYGVLWIEWVDGVAYRKGCGIVGKQSWESHELEEVNLVLG